LCWVNNAVAEECITAHLTHFVLTSKAIFGRGTLADALPLVQKVVGADFISGKLLITTNVNKYC